MVSMLWVKPKDLSQDLNNPWVVILFVYGINVASPKRPQDPNQEFKNPWLVILPAYEINFAGQVKGPQDLRTSRTCGYLPYLWDQYPSPAN